MVTLISSIGIAVTTFFHSLRDLLYSTTPSDK